MPAEWLPKIWGEEDTDIPKFKNAKEENASSN
jgi:uncharacterized protein